MQQQLPMAERGGGWPVWSMLLCGHFGADASLASQRADLRSRIAIGVAAVVILGVGFGPALEPAARRQVISALLGLLLAYLGWQRWQYVVGLDELARRLYLEAFAVTYLLGLVLFSIFTVLQPLLGWTMPPLVFLWLEPVRALVLAWRSRRFA